MSDLFSCKVGPFQIISFSLQIMLLLKAGSSWNKYFINRRQIFLSGLFGGLFVSFFIKSWIFKKITGQSVTVSICQSSDCKLNSIYTALQVSMQVFVSIHPSIEVALDWWFSIFDVILKLTLYNTEILPVKKVIGGDLIRESQSNLYDLIKGSEYCWCSLSKQKICNETILGYIFVPQTSFCVITSHVITLISFSSSLNDYWNILNNWFRHIF